MSPDVLARFVYMKKLTVLLAFMLFFFSSRRRHTRWPRDWSSDVCSSDLVGLLDVIQGGGERGLGVADQFGQALRSEERRVGKECRTGGATSQQKKKQGLAV